jgi:hypothetical protein
MNIHVDEASRVFPPFSKPLTSDPLLVKPNLEPPNNGCIGFAIVDLAQTMDSTNASYVSVATQVCRGFLQNLQSFSTENLKKLEERASLLKSSEVWSAISHICSFIGSTIALFTGILAPNPTLAALSLGLGVLPFVYTALSSGVEQKELEKGAVKLGILLATAFFFAHFRGRIPALNAGAMLSSGVGMSETVLGIVTGIYSARLTLKQGDLEALQFLTNELQTKLREMTGSMTADIESVATNTSCLRKALEQYIATKTTFIRR